jgi:polyhydroxybutyrate depolymerase
MLRRLSAALAWTVALAACGAASSSGISSSAAPTDGGAVSDDASPGDVPDGGDVAESDAGSDSALPDAGNDGSAGDGGSPTPSGCGLTPPATGFMPNQAIDVGGTTYNYDLFVPPTYDPSTPISVVFVFHADVAASLRPFFPIENASGGNAIVVYPYSPGGWDLGPSATNTDQAFIQALAASLEASYCIAPARRFGYGYSNGAFFINLMACFAPPFFRAIAVNSGSIYAPDGQPVTYDDNGHPICPATAAMVIHGTNDTQVKYSDGLYARDTWLAADACDSTTTPFGPSPCVMYAGGTQPVAFCSFTGGHTIWTSAATASWAFFSSL